jgi:adenylate/guanylate cyclase family protein
MPTLPSGTVTFLFTDIEASTRLAQQHPQAWEAARQRHHAILRTAVDAHAGHVFQVVGDAVCAAFATASDALHAALEAQHALHAEAWGDTPIRVRMGLHTGSAESHDGDYRGYLTLVRVQRVMSGIRVADRRAGSTSIYALYVNAIGAALDGRGGARAGTFQQNDKCRYGGENTKTRDSRYGVDLALRHVEICLSPTDVIEASASSMSSVLQTLLVP